MQIAIRHEFACSPAEFWEIFWEPEYDRILDEAAGTKRIVLREWAEDGKRCWISRFEAVGETRDASRALLGSSLLGFEQENRFDAIAGVLEWKVIPDMGVARAAVDARGVLFVRPAPRGCERIVEGTIRVSVPFLGPRIEEAIRDQVQSSYESAARATSELIVRRRS